MDHLPVIEDPAYPLPNIPCFCHVSDYDGRGMFGFPERVGWQIDRQNGPLRVDKEKSRIETPEALLQAWLFFGLLHDVVQTGELDFDMSTFKQKVGDQSFVTLAALKGQLDRLANDAVRLDVESYLKRQKIVQGCFNIVLGFLDRHWDTLVAKGNWNISTVFSLDHIMLIIVLGETLKNAIAQVWPVSLERSPLRWQAFIRRQNPLRDPFLQHGWCPNEAAMLFKEFDNTGLLLASMLKRPFSDQLSHEMCSEERCLALQTSDVNYETKHEDGCSSCTSIIIDQRKICSILKCGGIPMVYVPVFPEDGEAPKVRIIDYNANNLEYIAISHVWAHGLGNPTTNALPSCQILRLKSLSAKLVISTTSKFQQPAFWIDTLCIPVDPEYKAMRKLAIGRLATTYRQARQVLILDADLQRCSKRCSKTEMATRIVCSGWMKRLWTLQEAVMSDKGANAGKVDVQFLEGPIEFNAIGGKNIQSLQHTEHAKKTIYSAFPQYRNRDRAYAFLARALEYRTTSKLEDEAICLASVLGMEPKSIASIAGAKTAEERMQILYTCMGQIPASVLFHRSRKLENGFRWAPATLLGNKQNYSFRGVGAKCDAAGLHVKFAGYVMIGHSTLWQEKPRLTQHNRYIGDVKANAPNLVIMSRETGVGNATGKSALDDSIKLDTLLNGTPTPAFILNPDDSTESALVSVTGEEEDVLSATFLSKIYVRKPRMESGVHDDWRNNLIDVREVSSDQSWCIR